MKNLKKALALVLAIALCFSLVTIAGATNYDGYADASTVAAEDSEAVDLVVGLGIINGTDGNKLDLTGNLTRAEAAKILTVLDLGTDLAASVDSKTVDTGFSDTKNHWASGYIAYCASQGYLVGSLGKFEPDEKLTGYAFGKMLLNVLGYGLSEKIVGGSTSTVNKYEGDQWAINVAVDGKKINLFTNVDSDLNGAITRVDAMNMVNNALKVWADSKKANETDVTFKTYALASEFEYKTATGVVVSNSSNSANEYTTVAVITAGSDGKITTLTETKFAVDTDLDALGTVVTINYKYAASEPAKGYTVYTVAEKSTAVTISTAISGDAAKVTAAFGKGVDDAAAVYNFNASYTGSSGSAITGWDSTDLNDASQGTYYIYNGEIVSYVAPITYTLQKVTGYTAPTEKATGTIDITGVAADGSAGTAAQITLQKVGSETADVINLYDGIAEGDYVYYQKFGTAVAAVVKATVVENVTVSAYTASKSLVADKTYSLSGVTAGTITGFTAIATAPTLGTTAYNLVLDRAGAVIGYETYTAASTASEYAFVIAAVGKDGEAASVTNGYKATYATANVYVVLANGSTAVLSYTSATATTKTAIESELDSLANGDIIKFAADNGVLTEKPTKLSTTEASGWTEAAIKAKTANVADGKYLSASTPIVYIKNSSGASEVSATVITGYANAQAATADNAYFVVENDAAVVVFVKGGYSTATTAKNVAYTAAVTSSSYSTTKYDADLKATVYGYNVYVDGVETTLWAKSGTLSGLSATAGYIEYTLTDGYLSAVTNTVTGYTTVTSQTVNFIDGTTVALGATEYTYAGANIITVSAANGVSAGGTLAKDQTVTALVKDGAVVYAAIITA